MCDLRSPAAIYFCFQPVEEVLYKIFAYEDSVSQQAQGINDENLTMKCECVRARVCAAERMMPHASVW